MTLYPLRACAAVAVLLVPFGVPAAGPDDAVVENDVALDLSLPDGHPMIVHPAVARGGLDEALPPAVPSPVDIPMLGSALDMPETTQVGTATDAE